jgi:DNA repair photolyase
MNQKSTKPYIKSRGAQIQTINPFDSIQPTSQEPQWVNPDEMDTLKKTNYMATMSKSILNKVDSPDIGLAYSMNPYQGCEHGCVYCYARNTHNYWGFGAGIDFEQKILYKLNAAKLLEKKITSQGWKPQPIMLSGNTDCYQPAEKKYKITRSMLEVLMEYRHPVGIITKSQLILRDLDILEKMAAKNLVHVAVSLTSLNDELTRKLEPRTSPGSIRLKTIAKLSDAGIPVRVMYAPVIPSINDGEVHQIAAETSKRGARAMNHIIVRLNGKIGEIFEDWLRKNFPQKADRVLNQIRSCHGGQLFDSRFGVRMKGEGNFAKIIGQQVKIARETHFKDKHIPAYDFSHFRKSKYDTQLKIF